MATNQTTARQRPSWDDYFLNIAFTVAERSTCDRAHVGSVIVRDRRILTTGYNGAPAGLPHCDDVGHLMVDNHCMRTLHAEQNAIIQAALHGVSIAGATIYVTHQPCLTCAKMIINAGITRVVYAGNYPDEHSRHFFHEAAVSLEYLPRQRSSDSVYTPEAGGGTTGIGTTQPSTPEHVQGDNGTREHF